MADGDDLLGGLPKTRPTRRTSKAAGNRPKAAPGTPAQEAGAPARPKPRAKAASARANARPAPARRRPPQAPGGDERPPAASPQAGGLAGLAQQGLGAAAGVVRGVLRRLPRP